MSLQGRTNKKRILFLCVLFLVAYFATFLRVDSCISEEISGGKIRLEAGDASAKLSSYHPFSVQNTEMLAEKVVSGVMGHLLRGRMDRLELERNFILLYLSFGGAILLSAIFWNIVWMCSDLRIITRAKQLIGILHRSDGKKRKGRKQDGSEAEERSFAR